METLTQMEVSTQDEAKKLLRLIIATWPEHSLSRIRIILNEAEDFLKHEVETQIEEKERELKNMAIKDLNLLS